MKSPFEVHHEISTAATVTPFRDAREPVAHLHEPHDPAQLPESAKDHMEMGCR